MVSIGGYVHPTDTFGISTSGEAEPTMSMIYDDGQGCDLGSQPAPFWYWITNCPMIRLNFGEFIVNSIRENTFEGILSVYPNPSQGKFILELKDVESDLYALTIKDVLGKDVLIQTIEVAGSVKHHIDISVLEKGAYILNVSNSNSTIATKLIIE